jgi:phage terminase large subunit-like protein
LNLQEAISLSNQGLLTAETLKGWSTADCQALATELIQLKSRLRQESQLEFYVPASDRARQIHYSTSKIRVAVGGNRSSKSTTTLADLVICMTGIIPHSLPDYPKEKIQCPGNYRIVCESLTNTWAPVIRPKLQWDKWNGKPNPGGPLGHWGLIPKKFLKKGRWDESWSEKERILTLTCGCTLQICSYDQDVQDQSGSSLNGVCFDEGPASDMWDENKMRTIDTNGWLSIAFTPPAEDTTAWKAAWIYEELYEKGIPGPEKDPDIDIFELWTRENRILDQQDIDKVFKGLTPAQKETRGKGAFMHLGGRIYPVYTDTARQWCFNCSDIAFIQENSCAVCQNSNVVSFNHFVEPFETAYTWPCVFLLDPHPRKPNMMSWITVDPSDDWWQIAEMEVDGAPNIVRDKVFSLERALRLNVAARLIDPNMAESPAHSAGARHVTVRDEFDAVGLRTALSDDSFDVGIQRVREFLKPDPRTRSPRLHIFNNCRITNSQIKKYTWDEHATSQAATKKDAKSTPITKNDDFPTLIRYFANANFTFRGLMYGGKPISATRTVRKKAYG